MIFAKWQTKNSKKNHDLFIYSHAAFDMRSMIIKWFLIIYNDHPRGQIKTKHFYANSLLQFKKFDCEVKKRYNTDRPLISLM